MITDYACGGSSYTRKRLERTHTTTEGTNPFIGELLRSPELTNSHKEMSRDGVSCRRDNGAVSFFLL